MVDHENRDLFSEYGPNLANLVHRMGRKIAIGRGMTLTPEDLNLIVVTGAYDKLQEANADYQREQAKARLELARKYK